MNIMYAIHEDMTSDASSGKTIKTAASIGGGTLGGYTGAYVGSTVGGYIGGGVGSLFGGFGAVPGAALGSMAGGLFGAVLGTDNTDMRSNIPKFLQRNLYHTSPLLCRFSASSTVLHEEGHQHERSTVDEEDVKHYNNLASRWWDESGDMKGLHALNKLRVQFIRDGLVNVGQLELAKWKTSQPLKGIKILEVGCGGGILTEPLARIGADVTGIDASENMIETAKLHASRDPGICSRITYVRRSVEEHVNEHKDFYDAVVASEVLEHVTHKDLFVQACISTIKPGGSIFITTLNKTLVMWAAGIVLAEYVLRLVPRGTHDLNKFIKPHEMQALLEKNDCTTKLVHGMVYNFLTNEWFWSPNTSMNYALHAVRRKKS